MVFIDHHLYLQNPSIHHPKTLPLGLHSEKVIHISAASVRCSVATESGKVATWMDETLSDVASRLEQPAQAYTEVRYIFRPIQIKLQLMLQGCEFLRNVQTVYCTNLDIKL